MCPEIETAISDWDLQIVQWSSLNDLFFSQLPYSSMSLSWPCPCLGSTKVSVGIGSLGEERSAELQALPSQDPLWSFSVCAALPKCYEEGKGASEKLVQTGGRTDQPHSGKQIPAEKQELWVQLCWEGGLGLGKPGKVFSPKLGMGRELEMGKAAVSSEIWG